MEVDGAPKPAAPAEVDPEIEAFVSVLVLTWLIDQKRIDDARTLSERLVDQLATWNRRTLDPLSAKVYFFLSRSYELANRLADIRVYAPSSFPIGYQLSFVSTQIDLI